MKKVFEDVLAHTHGLGFIDMVKVVGTDDDTKLECMSENKNVVLYAGLSEPIAELEGTTGLARMAVLSGYLRFPAFQDDSASMTVVRGQRGSTEVPVQIDFAAPGGHRSTYRFMSPEVADEIKVPVFRGVNWDLTVTPDEGSLRDLSYFAGILGSFDPVFVARTDGDTLVFSIGSGSNDRTDVPFATGVSGSLAGRWAWPLAETLSILKLAVQADSCAMMFSEKGALKIEMTTEHGVYEYILPAKTV